MESEAQMAELVGKASWAIGAHEADVIAVCLANGHGKFPLPTNPRMLHDRLLASHVTLALKALGRQWHCQILCLLEAW